MILENRKYSKREIERILESENIKKTKKQERENKEQKRKQRNNKIKK